MCNRRSVDAADGYIADLEAENERLLECIERIGKLLIEVSTAVVAGDWRTYYESMSKMRDMINDLETL